MKIVVAALLSVSFLTPAFAQAQAPQVMQASIAPVAPSTSNILRAGTSVPLKMSEALTTEGKKLRVGQRFQLEVASDVISNGVTIIPAGSPATGEVTDVRNKGMWGKSGRINARVLSARVNGRQIRLTGSIDDKGVTGTAGVVGAIVFIPIAGFIMTGTSARIPLAAPVNAFLDEDVPFDVVAAAPVAPMVVIAPAVAPAAAPMTAPLVPVSTAKTMPTIATTAPAAQLIPVSAPQAVAVPK